MFVRHRVSLDEKVERELSDKWRLEGDKRALDRLVESHLALVIRMAQDLSRGAIPVEDLVQEGAMGLTVAAQKFDPTKGTRLVTYATYWVKAYMMRYVLRTYGPVRMDTTRPRRKIFYNLGKARRALEEAGLEVNPETVAKEIGVPVHEVETMLPYLTANTVSVDSGDLDGHSALEIDQTTDPANLSTNVSVEDAVSDRRAREAFHRAIKTAFRALNHRERDIIRERYMKEPGATLRGLSRMLGISAERVRQVERQAKTKLKVKLSAAGVDVLWLERMKP
jgi:RNA polymerase sigma-32 factor